MGFSDLTMEMDLDKNGVIDFHGDSIFPRFLF